MRRPPWIPRHALEGDIAAIEALISRSVRALHRPFYSELQIDASIGTVFGVDRLHQSVPRVLIAVGILAILWYHPRKFREVSQ